jgi:hypothetical protein
MTNPNAAEQLAVLALENIASKAAQVALLLKTKRTWPGDVSAAVAEIEKQLEFVKAVESRPG